MRKFLIFVLVFILAGCVTYTAGYTPKSTIKNNINIDKEQRKNITFSLSYNSQVGDELSSKIQKSMIDEVKHVFGESHLFRRVHYYPFNPQNKYHYHFDIKLTGLDVGQQMGAGYLIGLTLAIVPAKINYYMDITMFVFEDGKEIYSVTAPEEVVDLYWLPLIIGSPFMNHYTAISRVTNRANNFFIQKIIENKLYE